MQLWVLGPTVTASTVLEQDFDLSVALRRLSVSLPERLSQFSEHIVLSIAHLLGIILIDHLLQLFHTFLSLCERVRCTRHR